MLKVGIRYSQIQKNARCLTISFPYSKRRGWRGRNWKMRKFKAEYNLINSFDRRRKDVAECGCTEKDLDKLMGIANEKELEIIKLKARIKELEKIISDGILKDHNGCMVYHDEEYTKLESKFYEAEARIKDEAVGTHLLVIRRKSELL